MKKIQGQEIVTADQGTEGGNIINLMDALEKSLELTQNQQGMA